MHVRYGFEFTLQSSLPTPIASIVQSPVEDTPGLVAEHRSVTPDVEVREYTDTFGNRVWRWVAPEGEMKLRYDAIAEISPDADPTLLDLPGTFVDNLPDETIMFTLPSRYCPSDLAISDAWQLFGDSPDGWRRVQAICDWLHTNIVYGYGSSTSTTTGYDAFQNRKGVCRDFAHMGVMFCRAMNIPARYVYGYLPDIAVEIIPTAMDFHAWFEAYVDGAWRTFDARHNMPRIGRVIIARGRDAVDTAIMTTYGDSRLVGFTVWADEVPEGTTLNDLIVPTYVPPSALVALEPTV